MASMGNTPLFSDNWTFAAGLPRQQGFLRRVVPAITGLPQVHALWLTGSLARGDADRWSSVDLCLLLDDNGNARGAMDALQGVLTSIFGPYYVVSYSHLGPLSGGRLSGMTLAEPLEGAGSGGVCFDFHWDVVRRVESFRAWHGPVRLLYTSRSLTEEALVKLTGEFPRLSRADEDEVEAGLRSFWLELADLPAVVNRREHLAAVSLLDRARNHLVNLIVAVNGARRPPSTTRVNQYLGPSQREALEKTLVCPSPSPDAWIAQAVALIVIYRWYAPQLREHFHQELAPTRLEETVLALLAAEIDGWPARITTG